MDKKSAPTSHSRRDFLATSSLLAVAAAAPGAASALAGDAATQSSDKPCRRAFAQDSDRRLRPRVSQFVLRRDDRQVCRLGSGGGGDRHGRLSQFHSLSGEGFARRSGQGEGLEKEVRGPQHSGGYVQLPRQPCVSRSEDRRARRGIIPAHRALGGASRSERDRGLLRLSRRQSHRHHAELGHLPLAARVRARCSTGSGRKK